MVTFRPDRRTLFVYLISLIEIAIGCCTIVGLAASSLFSLSNKSENVFIFVLLSAIISSSLGLGLYFFHNWARKLLIFFSGWVILTKILVLVGILQFSGELITAVSDPVKNTVSVLYHAAVIATLNSDRVRELFSK